MNMCMQDRNLYTSARLKLKQFVGFSDLPGADLERALLKSVSDVESGNLVKSPARSLTLARSRPGKRAVSE